jgi:PKD repeat protein
MVAAVLVAVISGSVSSAAAAGVHVSSYNSEIESMIQAIDEDALYRTTYDLQNFTTRVYPSEGNVRAGTYVYDRFSAIPGLEVSYSDDPYRSVIATLPGTDDRARGTVIVGAHYDSDSNDVEIAPGATDNGCGVAIVLELARIMSVRGYDRTIQFICWNGEGSGKLGSYEYVRDLDQEGREVPLYLNYDAAYYDPERTFAVDITNNDEAMPLADAMDAYNDLYGLGLTLTFNQNPGSSDHTPFREFGYPALDFYILDEYEEYHTPEDTVDLVSLPYAKKLAQIGLVVLAETADRSFMLAVPGGFDVPLDPDGDGKYEDVDGNGRRDLSDVALYFNQMGWIEENEPRTAFDFDDNGRIDFSDTLGLFDR